MGIYKTASILNRVKNFLSPESIDELKSALKNVQDTNSKLMEENKNLKKSNRKTFTKGLLRGAGIGVAGGTATTAGVGMYLHNKELKKRPMAVINEETRSPKGNIIRKRKVSINPDVLNLATKQIGLNRPTGLNRPMGLNRQIGLNRQ